MEDEKIDQMQDKLAEAKRLYELDNDPVEAMLKLLEMVAILEEEYPETKSLRPPAWRIQ